MRAMLARPADHALTVHGGLHYGPVVRAGGDIFGEAVNLTARLAALANADEALFSRSFVDRLPRREAAGLRPLDRIRLKGVSSPIEIYSFVAEDPAMQTQTPGAATQIRAPLHSWSPTAGITLVLTHGRDRRRCGESESMLIGRSDQCDIVLAGPWISRKHAVVTVRDGKVMLDDRSSSGTYVAIVGGHELLLRRETTMLTGKGVISPAMHPERPEAEPIRFEIVRLADLAMPGSGSLPARDPAPCRQKVWPSAIRHNFSEPLIPAFRAYTSSLAKPPTSTNMACRVEPAGQGWCRNSSYDDGSLECPGAQVKH